MHKRIFSKGSRRKILPSRSSSCSSSPEPGRELCEVKAFKNQVRNQMEKLSPGLIACLTKGFVKWKAMQCSDTNCKSYMTL